MVFLVKTIGQKWKNCIQFCLQYAFQFGYMCQGLLNRGVDGNQLVEGCITLKNTVDLCTFCIEDAGKGFFFIGDGGSDAENNSTVIGWAVAAGSAFKFIDFIHKRYSLLVVCNNSIWT